MIPDLLKLDAVRMRGSIQFEIELPAVGYAIHGRAGYRRVQCYPPRVILLCRLTKCLTLLPEIRTVQEMIMPSRCDSSKLSITSVVTEYGTLGITVSSTPAT
jgi:hypothetical protein